MPIYVTANIVSNARCKRKSAQPKAERSGALGVNGMQATRAVSAKVLSTPINVYLCFCAYSATTTFSNNGPTALFRYAAFTVGYALLRLQRGIIKKIENYAFVNKHSQHDYLYILKREKGLTQIGH